MTGAESRKLLLNTKSKGKIKMRRLSARLRVRNFVGGVLNLAYKGRRPQNTQLITYVCHTASEAQVKSLSNCLAVKLGKTSLTPHTLYTNVNSTHGGVVYITTYSMLIKQRAVHFWAAFCWSPTLLRARELYHYLEFEGFEDDFGEPIYLVCPYFVRIIREGCASFP